MPKRYNINPIKDFDLTEYSTGGGGTPGEVNWGEIGGTLSNQGDLQTALDSKVNDTGDTMTGDLAFTNAGINNANQITFNTGATETITEGVLTYNQNTGNLELGLAGGNVSVALGKGLMLPRRCKNESGTTMTKGTVVYISGVSGNNPLLTRAVNTSDSTSAYTIGLTAEDITDGQTGWVVFQGELSGLNLASYTAGDTVYLSATAGQFTATKPSAPNHYVRIGIITKATASGEMIVNIINGFELQELHNVQINGVATGNILQYQTDGLWKNVTLSGVITNHNSLSGIQGGTTNEYNHLTNLQVSNLNNQSGTNTGDVTVTDSSTIDFTLTGQAITGSVIQSGITHNNLGSLQGGTAGQYNHLTNSELAVVQATSGSNTGDVSVIDTLSVDLTLSGQVLQANVIPSAITHNSLGEIQGGTVGQYNHITNLELQTLQATSGTNTGDITVQDTRSVDLTLSGQLLQANVLPSAITHNSLAELQGGTTGQMFHLTSAKHTQINNLTANPANTSAVTNQFITAYNSTTGAFTQARPTWANIDKTTSPINDLSDVVISSVQNNEVLTYEASTNSWKNKSNPIQENILENANFINNSTNGYGGISNGWTNQGANAVQGGFPYLEWDAVYSPGATTGFWYLNEASGNAIDGKTGTYTLTDTNTVGASATLGLMDYARSFDGVNKRFSGTVALGNVVGSQTFVAFVRPNVVNVAQHICGYNDGTRNAYIGINASGKPFFNFTGTTPTIVTADVTCEANKWYLIIGSYDSGAGTLNIFVNGVYKSVSCTGTHVVTTNNIFQIGATNSANHFNGYINAVAHYYEVGWDKERCLSLFAVSIYKNTKIYRSDTTSEISLYQLLGREQMHRFNSQTVTFSAEVYQTNASNAKVTIYNGSTNYDSNIASSTGAWETVSVTFTFGSANAEVYFNLRTSSGAVGPIWYRNIKLNYGNVAIGNNIHNVLDWQKFPRLLMLDIPKMFDAYPYQYEENKWYSWTPTLAPAGSSNAFTTEWKFSGDDCYLKGQITSTHATSTWTHTLPIYTGTNEAVYTKHIKIQNNAGTLALGNWQQTTGNSTTVSMFSSIANGTWSTTSGVKIAQIDSCNYEID